MNATVAAPQERSTVRLGSAVLRCIVLICWLQFFFLAPLKENAIRMHGQQLDPTEIVAIPYDLQRLTIYVLGTLVAATFLPQHGFRNLPDVLGISVVVFGLFLLCGASPIYHLLHTALAALYLTTLSSWAIQTSGMKTYLPLRQQFLQHLRGPSSTSSLYVTTTQSTLAMTIVFQILLLYDRGWQAQRWPVPIVLGSSLGWMLGTLGTAIYPPPTPAPRENRIHAGVRSYSQSTKPPIKEKDDHGSNAQGGGNFGNMVPARRATTTGVPTKESAKTTEERTDPSDREIKHRKEKRRWSWFKKSKTPSSNGSVASAMTTSKA